MVMVDFGIRDSRRTYVGETDYCTKEGAEELAARIVNYWADRGYSITVSTHEMGFHETVRHTNWIVRSTLKNGRPEKSAHAVLTHAKTASI